MSDIKAWCFKASGLLLGGLLGLNLFSLASAKEVSPREWQVNSWGEEPPQVEQGVGVDDQCRSGADAGVHFRVGSRKKGRAELILPAVLSPRHAYEFTAKFKVVGGNANAAVPVDIFFRKDDAHYQTAVVRTVALNGNWQEVSLKGVYFLDGPGSVRLSSPQGAPRVCIAQAKLSEISPDTVGGPHQAFKVTPQLFGVHLNQLGSHNGWPTFNPGIVRLWDAGTTWGEIQPNDGGIDWSHTPGAVRMKYYDSHVKRFGAGRSKLMMTLGMTPTWAAVPGDCGPAPYGKSSCLMPQNRADWRRFVASLARKFDGRVAVWEVWNEADIGYHWAGSANGLVDLLKDAHDELKSANSENIVIGPNVTVNGLRLLNDMLNLGAGKYMDGLSFHGYFGRTPAIALGAVRNIRQMLAYHGLDMPLWNTEVGVGCDLPDTCRAMGAPGGRRAGLAAIAQGLIGEAALGVVNTNYHTWEGGAVQGGNLPLVESDFETDTDAGRLYARLRKQLNGQELRWLGSLPDGGGLVEMVSSAGKVCVWAWGPPSGVAVPIASFLGAQTWQTADGDEAGSLEGRSSVSVKSMPVLACKP